MEEKAYDMVPSDPRVMSGYGEVLVRNGSVDEGLDLLDKALELDPVPQGQLNSDKRFFLSSWSVLISFSIVR